MIYVFVILIIVTTLRHLCFWKPCGGKRFYKNTNFMLISHRGYHKKYPENTTQSIKRAILKGFRAVEVDVYPSGDNEIFCSHNLDLERETEGGGFIDELNSETIINIACNTQKKSYIPTLTSVFHKYNQKTMWIIDVKTKSLFHIKHAYKIIKIIKEHNLTESTIVSSFNPLFLWYVKIIEKKIMTGLILKTQKLLILTNIVHPDFLHLRADIVNEKTIKYSTRKKTPINAWTVNNKPSTGWLKSLGVSGIITDEAVSLDS